MLVKIDSREKERIISAKEYYESQGLEVEVCKLDVGDYLFDNKVCMEFKLIPDFISSVQNNRVFNQAINQSENYKHHFILIYGTDKDLRRALAIAKNRQARFNYLHYIGAIASLNVFTTVIEVKSFSITEAYYRMLVQAQKCITNKPLVKKFTRKTSNPAYNYLATIQGISGAKANMICKELNLKKLSDLMVLSFNDLISLQGIGEKTANNIMEAIK